MYCSLLWGESGGYEADGYKYGFNGKEIDTETSLQDYGFRMYDPLIARFISVDPLSGKFPWWTPYAFAGNSPVMAIDLDGLELAPWTMPFPIEPILTIPRGISIPVPTLPNTITVPPVSTIPNELTVGQPTLSQSRVEIRNADIDWENPPAGPEELGEDWEETENSKKNPTGEHRTYRDNESGNEVRWDVMKKNKKGGVEPGHWHRINPKGTDKVKGRYLDAKGNPCDKGSLESHIYPKSVLLPTINVTAPRIQPEKPGLLKRAWQGIKEFFTPKPEPYNYKVADSSLFYSLSGVCILT